ncbi:MAG: YdcF family protein [Bryobacteraceae bacterium]
MRFPSGPRRGAVLWPLLALLCLAVLVWFLWEPALRQAGLFLDAGAAPRRSDAILVLAGGWTGERMLKAGELIRAGYAPKAYVSGPGAYYGSNECELAIPFAAARGFPAGWFECLPNDARSTRDEARILLPELERRGVKTLLIVSVRTHLRRARWLFEKHRPADMRIHYTGADHPAFRLEQWYKYREGRKAVVLEWIKILSLPADS